MTYVFSVSVQRLYSLWFVLMSDRDAVGRTTQQQSTNPLSWKLAVGRPTAFLCEVACVSVPLVLSSPHSPQTCSYCNT